MLTRSMNIVGIGGGTGLPVLLRGLKQLRERHAEGLIQDLVYATAIVCVSDDGGSSGLLRRAFGIPAVGDLRNCLVALSAGNPTLREIFQYRLRGDNGLDGHSLGNLIVAALSARSGNLRHAVRLASEFLDLQGDVLPCTEVSASLCAEFVDGDVVCGETNIAARCKRIRRVWLDPPNTHAAPGVIDTILEADAIVLGPGSLHTSVIPNLLPDGVIEAIQASSALKILVCNLMTQPGETDHYSASDHVKTIQRYLGERCLHICLLNTRPIEDTVAGQYAEAGAQQVVNDEAEILRCGVAPVAMDVLAEGDREVRHEPMKLARWVVALTRAFQRACELRAGDVHCLSESLDDAQILPLGVGG
jgi:uncharacterized cofD-like protein